MRPKDPSDDRADNDHKRIHADDGDNSNVKQAYAVIESHKRYSPNHKPGVIQSE